VIYTTMTVASMENTVPVANKKDAIQQLQRYLVLVEFVYRHLNFQLAELKSILEAHGIHLGSSGCEILPLPVSPASTTINNRAFVILSFPIGEAKRWSGLTQTHEEQRKNIKFDPRIKVVSSSSTSSSSSIADVLYKCTLVKSVVELWGYSSTNLKDCAEQSFQWLNRKTNNNEVESSSLSESSSSFQRDCILPLVCDDPERPWKFTIHTLGTKVKRDEQDLMRKTFKNTLDFLKGPVKLNDPTTQEFLLIREIELDGKGSALLRGGTTNNNSNKTSSDDNDDNNPNNNTEMTATQKNNKNNKDAYYNTDAIAYYFGRVLGGRIRSNEGSRGLDHYSLKSRPYLGPTSMDAELSFVMTSLGKVTTESIVYDPFVGTGSILLACAMRGAYCIGSDIDIRVLRGKGGDQTIWKNFEHYKLPRPEIIRSDNALYHRHYRHHHQPTTNISSTTTTNIAPHLYDAIICDPPYGIRAGARQTGSKLDNPRPVLEENRHNHIAQTKTYSVSDVMSDLLDVAASTLKVGGRLVYIIPSFRDFDEDRDLPRHDCLELIDSCFQPFSNDLGRRIVAMKKIIDYDVSKRTEYLQSIWIDGAESAEKCANLRDKIMEAAREKPGYEAKAAIRKVKRKANKEAKKQEKKRSKQEEQEEQIKSTI
jgi:tRNA (guanine10-N2)-methyltransferase